MASRVLMICIFFLGATAKASKEAGVRGFIGMTVIDVPTAWAKTTDEYFAKAIAFYQEYKNDTLITPHSPPIPLTRYQ